MKKINFIFIFCCTIAKADYLFYDIKDSNLYSYRKTLFSSIYPKLSFEEQGLYLFIENKDLRMFYIGDSDSIDVYVYPLQKNQNGLSQKLF